MDVIAEVFAAPKESARLRGPGQYDMGLCCVGAQRHLGLDLQRMLSTAANEQALHGLLSA